MTMVKQKTNSNKRRSFAADKHNKKTHVETTTKTNPFDLHVNRLKHDVLGKRRNYEKGGQPLKARARGVEKRKRTLLKEYNSVFKKNTFVDHRLGENDPTLTNEEKLMQRLIAERTKVRAGKDSRYNLNDEEDLTHYGQSLAKSDELNQKPVLDDYDDDQEQGRLKSEHFFGGFQSSKDGRKPMTKKEWIEDMIKTSKLDKYERQRENERVFDMTATLDEQWKALSQLMGIKEKKHKETKETTDDYDKLVNSLRFEAKTTGLPVQTIEEQEKETAAKLKLLQAAEKERMERPTLKSILSKNKQQTHRSVEELDESYYVVDGTNKHVTFDAEDEQQQPAVEIEELVEDEDEEEEETTDGDLTAEYEEIPSTLEKLKTRLDEDKNALTVIWKRINDKRLPAIPRSVLTIYFDVLLDHYDSISDDQNQLNQIGRNLLRLLQLVNNDQTKTNILERLKQYHQTVMKQIEHEKFIEVDRSFILFFKLIAHLYPTSDFRHPITTPAMTLLIEVIHHASLRSLTSCRQALLLVELLKQWISKSHRYVPEVLVLLIKCLQMAFPLGQSPYFISCSSKQIKDGQLLLVTKDIQISTPVKVNFFETDDLGENKDEHRASILNLSLHYVNEFLHIYQSLPAIIEISQSFKSILSIINDQCPNQQISTHCREILDFIQKNCQIERQHLQQGKQAPKILRLFQPRFGPVYEGKKNTRAPKEFTERVNLKRKYKRESKATARVLRLDHEFIAREELRDQMNKDSQRKRKVKEILGQASTQEGEYRKMKKIT